MWENLPKSEKKEYKKMILVFASLTELFAQKATENKEYITPILNSKYQETVFRKVFHAYAEDIGNTSFDASIDRKDKKYLIGLKTFGYTSGDQKIAQFKASHNAWSGILERIRLNSLNPDNSTKRKEEINKANKELYLALAHEISSIRNKRIESSKANIKGFLYNSEIDIEAVYHVLMPAVDSSQHPFIAVGETSYEEIDINNIEIVGCTDSKYPTNFIFTDKKHFYKFTSADSQLYMNFNNKNIVIETWEVKYAKDAYQLFSELANKIYEDEKESISESYCWPIVNSKGDVERFSGFNQFYGVGSKMPLDKRREKINQLKESYKGYVQDSILNKISTELESFLLDKAQMRDEKLEKEKLRIAIHEKAIETKNAGLLRDVDKMLYRPMNELYIPIPNSRKFHEKHPNFFTKDNISFNSKGNLTIPKEKRVFNLVFEPSGNTISSFIAQDWGKGIESDESMSKLGEWILREIFQLKEYEPLTIEKLNEVEINAIRLYKTHNSNDVHIQFTWINPSDPPKDLWI